jgi:hypothetical protein
VQKVNPWNLKGSSRLLLHQLSPRLLRQLWLWLCLPLHQLWLLLMHQMSLCLLLLLHQLSLQRLMFQL